MCADKPGGETKSNTSVIKLPQTRNKNDKADKHPSRLRKPLEAYSIKWDEICEQQRNKNAHNTSSKGSAPATDTETSLSTGEGHLKKEQTDIEASLSTGKGHLEKEQMKILEKLRNFSTAIVRNEIKFSHDTSITGRYSATKIEPFGCVPSSEEGCSNGFYDILKPSMSAYKTIPVEENVESSDTTSRTQQHNSLSGTSNDAGLEAHTQQHSSLSGINVDACTESLRRRRNSLSQILFPDLTLPTGPQSTMGNPPNPLSYQSSHMNTNFSQAESRFMTSASVETRALLFSAITDEIGRRGMNSLDPPSAITLPSTEATIQGGERIDPLRNIPRNNDDCLNSRPERNKVSKESGCLNESGTGDRDESCSGTTTAQRKNLGRGGQKRKMYSSHSSRRKSRRRSSRRKMHRRQRYKSSDDETCLSTTESSSSCPSSSEDEIGGKFWRKEA